MPHQEGLFLLQFVPVRLDLAYRHRENTERAAVTLQSILRRSPPGQSVLDVWKSVMEMGGIRVARERGLIVQCMLEHLDAEA